MLVIGAAAVAPLVACAVLALFRDSVANTNAALGLVLIIVAAAATGIRAAGIVAALSSAAWFDFFPTEPFNSFKITDRDDTVVHDGHQINVVRGYRPTPRSRSSSKAAVSSMVASWSPPPPELCGHRQNSYGSR